MSGKLDLGESGGKLDLDYMPMLGDRPMYYRLDADHNVLPATYRQLSEMYTRDFETTRRVGKSEVDGQSVSTVFLGLDHGWGVRANEPPIVFETMIFGGPYNEYQWRYSTWDEAVDGHARIVAALLAGIEP